MITTNYIVVTKCPGTRMRFRVERDGQVIGHLKKWPKEGAPGMWDWFYSLSDDPNDPFVGKFRTKQAATDAFIKANAKR